MMRWNLKSGSVSRLLLLLLLDLTNAVASSRSPITDCVHPTTALFLAGQSRVVHIYWRIYACAGTEERKTRSWPLRAVRLLNPTVGVSRLLTRAFSPPRHRPSWRQASPSPHLDPTVFPTVARAPRAGGGSRAWGAPPPPLRRHRRRRRRRRRVILPRIVKHAYPCGQVRKLQRKHRGAPSPRVTLPRVVSRIPGSVEIGKGVGVWENENYERPVAWD